MSAIEGHLDVRAYFHERLVEALRRQRVETATDTEFYLVNLLSRFARRADEEDPSGYPLVELLAWAHEASGQERLSRFRQLGDCALFILGFFSDNLDRRGISHDYVISLGGSAYGVARSIARKLGRLRLVTGPDVYHELCEKFETYVKVISEVREDTALRTPQDVLRLYERWQRTGSPRLAERLREAGLFAHLAGDPDIVH